jgi:hypothetical protein
MSEYRKEVNQVAKDSSWTFWRFLPLFLIVIVFISVLGFGLRSAGLFGKTVVERKVFENSYQRSEAIKSQIALDESVISEIRQKLSNPNLDANTRYNLEAHLSATKIRIETARRKQQ